jgi:hypothetical protein
LFAVRREVLDALFADPEWNKRFAEAKTMADCKRMIVRFCEAKGLKIKKLEECEYGSQVEV